MLGFRALTEAEVTNRDAAGLTGVARASAARTHDRPQG